MDLDPLWLMRLFTAIPVALILIAGAASIWIYFLVLSLLPDAKPYIETADLSADVRVVRDGNGVPGIIAEKEDDLAFVLGYVMAQDRLWQMDYLRRAGQGRLAEILGSDYLPGDHLMRTITAGVRGKSAIDRMGPRERTWLDRFVLGINRYLSSHGKSLPVEFSLLEYKPAPFSPEDVQSILLAVASASSPAFRVDPLMIRIMERLGKERAIELLPTDPAASPGFVASDLIGWEPQGVLFPRIRGIRPSFRVPGLRGGSVWAVGGAKSRSGKPLTSSVQYQALTAPGFWYNARLVAGDFHLSGTFIPGVPAAVSGSNRKMSWGCIAAPVDDADLFIERFDDDRARLFWRIDRFRRVEEFTERYRVRGGSSVSKTIRLTDTGPLVSDVNKGAALSLRWTARDGLGLYPALFSLNRSRDRLGLMEALKPLIAPSMYVVWAGEDGSYGVQTAGRIPIRAAGSDGILPMPAWTGVHDWAGSIPFQELPARTNPTDGIVAMSDGRTGGPQFPYFVSCYWNDGDRKARLEQLLAEGRDHQRESFQTIQADCFSPLARRLTPLLVRSLTSGKTQNRHQEDALAALTAWDFQMVRESSAAAVFGLVYQALVDELFRPALGEDLFDEFVENPVLCSRMVRRIFLDGDKQWLGATDPEHVLTRCIEKALERGKRLMGASVALWKWGDVHTTVFRHPLATRSRFLESLYYVGPIALPGAQDTVNFAGWSLSHPFSVFEGVSFRQITDMTDPPQVFDVNPLGSSGHFFSTHYKDQTLAWAGGRSFREPIDGNDIRKSGAATVLFKSRPPAAVSKR